MKIALYARVSTDGQDPEVQLQALRAHAANRGWTIVEEFVDHGYSGAKEQRPALDRMIKAAWTGIFQAVLVWRFDRFARSVKHLITALEQFPPSTSTSFRCRNSSTPRRRSAMPCSPSSARWPN